MTVHMEPVTSADVARGLTRALRDRRGPRLRLTPGQVAHLRAWDLNHRNSTLNKVPR